MIDPGRSSSRILTVAGLVGALSLAVPAGADASTVQNYTCADSAQSGATSASLTLTDPPASVTAGQSVMLQAGLTLTLPQSFDLSAKAMLISQDGLSTTNFGLQVQIGSTVQVVPASIVVGQLQTLGFTADTVTAALTFAAVNVPSTATGDVVISMPTAAQYANSATSTPAEVVFNAVLEQENYIGTPSDANLACYDSSTPAPAAQVVAQIPISAATATTQATTGKKTKPKTTKTSTSTKSKPATTTKSATKATSAKSAQTAKSTSVPSSAADATPGLAATASQNGTGVSAPTPAASSDQSAATPSATSSGSAASPTSASSAGATSAGATTAAVATATPASVTIPPRTVGKGTFIPTWELILMGSVFPIAALGYAWRMRRTYAAARLNLRESQTRT